MLCCTHSLLFPDLSAALLEEDSLILAVLCWPPPAVKLHQHLGCPLPPLAPTPLQTRPPDPAAADGPAAGDPRRAPHHAPLPLGAALHRLLPGYQGDGPPVLPALRQRHAGQSAGGPGPLAALHAAPRPGLAPRPAAAARVIAILLSVPFPPAAGLAGPASPVLCPAPFTRDLPPSLLPAAGGGARRYGAVRRAAQAHPARHPLLAAQAQGAPLPG